jgi:hypothetical protein
MAMADANHALFTPSAHNVYVLAFTISMKPTSITAFNVPVTMGGAVASTVTSGTTLNLAMLRNNTWVDVGTVVVGAKGAITKQTLASTTLPGMMGPGTYLLYVPGPGSMPVSNLGVALVADDGGLGVLQVVNLFDANGIPLATPLMTRLAYTNATDLDGVALTGDGRQGIMVDGGNTVRFFSNVQTGVPLGSTTSFDISAYGGDGDAVTILSNGDEAVISADSPNKLLVISGIQSGKPKAATTIPIPSNRDSLVLSPDDKVLLARGPSGLTVFSVTSIAPVTGSEGGTVSHSFKQVANLTGLGTVQGEARDGMAISPVDSTRALVMGDSGGNSYATLVTGLTGTPTVGTPIPIAATPRSVAIDPKNGKFAVVGTNGGIFLLTGVDTGNLTQVGAAYTPAYVANGNNVTLGVVPTLAITLDGKYVVVCDKYNSAMLVIPVTASGFGVPVSVLAGVAVPDNDQMVIH